MGVAPGLKEAMTRASWIRKMFEEGARLKARWGNDQVFDFSLGNPCLEPPESYVKALREHIEDPIPGKYGYMPNAGYPETRRAVAQYLSRTRGVSFDADHIVVTCGAAGGLNVVLKTLLNPGDEVVVLAPYFPEYLFYVTNHGGIPRITPTRDDFLLDIDAIEASLTKRTAAIIVNSPNNPTGRMYPLEMLVQLATILSKHASSSARSIYVISDEAYYDIVYDGHIVPDVLSVFENTIIVGSYSKSLSIPGERLGFIAIHPGADDAAELVDGFVFSNRILGFVNAPATVQHVIRTLQGVHVDMSHYQKMRDLLCEGLAKAGYTFCRPEGAFYLFPEVPHGTDDLSFAQALLAERVLIVPGRGFGSNAHFRIAYCVEEWVVRGALPIFQKVFKAFATPPSPVP